MTWYIPNISGEWWIDDGQVEFADGDVGEMNHEGYVVANLVRQVLSAADLDADDEFPELPYELGRRSAAPVIDDLLEHLIKDPEERAQAVRIVLGYQTPDPREYAIKYWGWIRFTGKHAQMWDLTSKSLKSLADGVAAAYEQDGGFDRDGGEEILAAVPLDIEVVSTGKYYTAVPYIVVAQAKPAALREYQVY